MRIAVDTNVLVRYLTADHAQQFAAARAALEGDDVLVISTIVLCELVWVLKGAAYGYSRAEITDILTALMATQTIDMDRPAAEAGVRMLLRGGDFADGIVEYEAGRARCERLVTFDATFARLATSRMVTLLPTA